MSDDQLTVEELRQLRQKATLRIEQVAEEPREAPPTVNYRPNQPPSGPEPTEVISRDDLFRNAARDRAIRRGRKETVPVDSVTTPLPTYESVDQTAEISNEQIEEVQSLNSLNERDSQELITTLESDAHGRAAPSEELDGTTEFTRVQVEDMDDKIEFPARVSQNYQISIPRDVAQEFDLDSGDLLIVTLHKVRG